MSPFSIFLFIPHQKLLTWYKPVDLRPPAHLPSCLTNLLQPDRPTMRCRLAYKCYMTGRWNYGAWFPISDEVYILRIIDRQNPRFAPEMQYWIEYKH